MSIINQANAHSSAKLDDDDVEDATSHESKKENSLPHHQDSKQPPQELLPVLRPNPSKHLVQHQRLRPRNFSPWPSLGTTILSPPQPAKLSKSPARGILSSLTKTPPRASYAEKVKDIFAGHRKSGSESAQDVERFEKISKKNECSEEIVLSDGRSARVIKTKKRIFLQYVDDHGEGVSRADKGKGSTDGCPIVDWRSEIDEPITSEVETGETDNDVVAQPSKESERSVQGNQDLERPSESRLGLPTPSCAPELATDDSAANEIDKIAVSAPTSDPTDHLLADPPEHRKHRRKRGRKKVKTTPASIPLSPPWKPAIACSSKQHGVVTNDDSGHLQILDDHQILTHAAPSTVQHSFVDKLPTVTEDHTCTDSIQIPQLDGASMTFIQAPLPASATTEVYNEIVKSDKVPIESLGHVSCTQSLVSPPWKTSTAHVHQPMVPTPPSPPQLNTNPLELSKPPPKIHFNATLERSQGYLYPVLTDKDIVSDIDNDDGDDSSDAWTDDSKFLPAYTMRRKEREARRQRSKQYVEHRDQPQRRSPPRPSRFTVSAKKVTESSKASRKDTLRLAPDRKVDDADDEDSGFDR